MFYLLENNRIIDSNVSYTKVLPFWEEKEGRLFAKCKSGKSYQVFKYDKIIKQSENVFDLIDWNNDLVRLTFTDGENFIAHCKTNKIDFNDGFYDFEWISAIYKPDGKGNYIKVWERKEEK
jgi:hypothetical protein